MTQVFQAEFEAKSILEGIAYLARLDPNFRVFGATGHRYKLNAPAKSAALEEVEATHRFLLPSDYRYFMLAVSDGGAGPNYGLKPLTDIVRGCDPGLPFDSKLCCGHAPEPGMIWLTDNGCATTTNLIVNGITTSGRTCDLYCEDARIVLGSIFRSWYLDWLNGAIRMLVKEPILKQIKIKMRLDDVRAILGDELVRHDPRQTLIDNYFLAFPDVNGAIQFDFSDRVVSTHFAPHCLTPRWDEPSDSLETTFDRFDNG